jgi:uncharacterized protein (UPF0548 family)
MVKPLAAVQIASLQEASTTYQPIGGTASASLPGGYGHLERRAALGFGQACFDRAAALLMQWQMHLRAGLSVQASSPQVTVGSVAVIGIGLGRLRVGAPVRVIGVVNEPRRRGFAYGTLPGHPEAGEESFVIEWGEDDRVVLSIRAFSRPGSLLGRASGPLGAAMQSYVTGRYLRALRD